MLQLENSAIQPNFPQVSNPGEIRERYSILVKQENSQEVINQIRSDLELTARNSESKPEDLIAVAKRIPAIEFLFKQDARILENYTIEEHTSMVLRQLDRYLATSFNHKVLSHAEMRIAMLFHDIGKSLPDEKKDQHLGTLQVLSEIEAYIPLSQHAKAIVRSLIANDPIGKYIVATVEQFASIEERKAIAQASRDHHLTVDELQKFADLVIFAPVNQTQLDQARQVVNEIALRAKELDVDIEELLNLHLLSYQADTSAYTYDSVAYNGRRAYPGLDFLYVLDQTFDLVRNHYLLAKHPTSGLLRFAPAVDEKIQLIKSAWANEKF